MEIVVTAAGIVSALGVGIESTRSALAARLSGVAAPRLLRTRHPEFPVGEVKLTNAEMRQRCGIGEGPASRSELMAILAIEEALAGAQILQKSPISSGNFDAFAGKIALINGTTVGGMDQLEERYAQLVEGAADDGSLAIHDCGACTQQIANHFGLFSSRTTLSTACSSAANAILQGVQMLQNGLADIAVVGGTEALTRFHFNGFRSLMILDEHVCRPFSPDHQGINLGEGAAFLVLESAESARKRGVTPWATVAGWGNACDAFHQTATSETAEGPFLAMQKALEVSGLQPQQIRYVNAHGTGTPNNDQSEFAALQRIFGENIPPFESTKPLTGHATSAAGSIEAVITLLRLQQLERGAAAMTNSFAFGGNDTSLIFKQFDAKNAETGAETPASHSVGVKAWVAYGPEAEIDTRRWISPLQSRRMDRQLKYALCAALEVLENAGVACPDAIITGTALGCVANTEKFLAQLIEQDEECLQPTHFMQSTHNTISSLVAIHTHCHGYNATYSQRNTSLQAALTDAFLQLRSGKIRNALVLASDLLTPQAKNLLEKANLLGEMGNFGTAAILLTADDSDVQEPLDFSKMRHFIGKITKKIAETASETHE